MNVEEFETVVPLSAWVASILWTVQEHWLGSFVLNLLGYALIILPTAYFIRKWKKDPAVQAGRFNTATLKLITTLFRISQSVYSGISEIKLQSAIR